MNEKQEVLYLIIIQQQEQQIKLYQKALQEMQIGLTVILCACLIYLLINVAISYNVGKFFKLFKNKIR